MNEISFEGNVTGEDLLPVIYKFKKFKNYFEEVKLTPTQKIKGYCFLV
jgi:hypothetical protein